MDDRKSNVADMKKLMTMPWRRMLATVFPWLDGKDARRRDLGFLIFRRNSPLATTWLVEEIVAPRRQVQYRLRALDVLESLGVGLPTDAFFDLSLALHQFGPAVGDRVARLLYPRS